MYISFVHLIEYICTAIVRRNAWCLKKRSEVFSVWFISIHENEGNSKISATYLRAHVPELRAQNICAHKDEQDEVCAHFNVARVQYTRKQVDNNRGHVADT